MDEDWGYPYFRKARYINILVYIYYIYTHIYVCTEVCGTDLSVKELSGGRTCIGVANCLQHRSGKDQETDACWKQVAEQIRKQLSRLVQVKCLCHALNESKLSFDSNTGPGDYIRICICMYLCVYIYIWS